ncbi:heavy-metal-associated domain-containing protein [Rhizobacter sp. J219]|uniref:heavy-metal-associated domain-containing protein n=1 Tax=Rhizobacter sp. J219 TaxID=2898430 RepID=UPI0027E21E2A|nr:heavy-metal-associated domain-containing protein [Rhizobacter sp. J219]
MKTFEVSDMTCGHCVSAVTRAVKAVDPAANVSVSLATKRVEVDSTTLDAQVIREAIAEAGYSAVEVAGGPAPAARAGGCCGSCH